MEHTLDMSREIEATNLRQCLEQPIKCCLRNVADNDIPVPSNKLDGVR
jgi:hypothetical protein